MGQQLINLGSTQAPYWEYEKTLAPNEHFKLNYVTDSFQLLAASADDALRVSFGGTMIQTSFTAGMGYKLTEPVEFVELWNDSAVSLTVRFVVGIGDIKDNRLTVSGNVLTQQVGWRMATGGTSTTTQNLTAGNGMFDIMVTAGSVTVDITGTNYTISGLVLPEGASWNINLLDSATVTFTPAASSSYNYIITQY